MLKTFLVIVVAGLIGAVVFGQNANQQNSNSQTTRTRTVVPKPSPTPKTVTKPINTEAPASQPRVQKTKSTEAGGQVSPPGTVLSAFNALLEGIRHADVKAVTNAYQNSQLLVLFNNNGTVTRGWEQLHENREASYPEMKDVKLEVKDLRVTMLGRDAALVTCLWTQSQTYKGTPETATGRMTLVFKRVGKDWKAIHLHTSPDRPEPTRVLPSEQSTPEATSPPGR